MHLKLKYAPEYIVELYTDLDEGFTFMSMPPWSDYKYYPSKIIEEHSIYLKSTNYEIYSKTTSTNCLIRKIREHVLAERGLIVPNNIGYLGIQELSNVDVFPIVAQQISAELNAFKNKDAIILDLRNASGGTIEGVEYLLSFFIGEGVHFTTMRFREGGDIKEKKYYTYKYDQMNGNSEIATIVDLSKKPLYVLVNNKTASAAECLAYDLKQFRRDVFIIGSPTKGGAHPYRLVPLAKLAAISADRSSKINEEYVMQVPCATLINPISCTN